MKHFFEIFYCLIGNGRFWSILWVFPFLEKFVDLVVTYNLFYIMAGQLQNDSPKSNSSVFGLIAIGICVVSLVTIRLFLSMILLGIVIFAIIGLIRDSKKIWSIVALIWAGFLVFGESQTESLNEKLYDVTYQVECGSCDVEHTNLTGGQDKFHCSPCNLNTTVKMKGSEYVTLSVFADDDNYGPIKGTVLVDGTPLKNEQSSGDRAHVYISVFPRDINKSR